MRKKRENTKLRGNWGENLAAEFLSKKGYEIISRGYSSRMGEIDIIAQNNKYIVFVEVKTRKNSDHGMPREFVTGPKRRRIRTTASIWLQNHESELQPRFDVIEILAPKESDKTKITHLEDAF